MQVVRLTESGVRRVLYGQVGMTFIVDCLTEDNQGRPIAHVRDYRQFDSGMPPYGIWSLSFGDYELIPWEPNGDQLLPDGEFLINGLLHVGGCYEASHDYGKAKSVPLLQQTFEALPKVLDPRDMTDEELTSIVGVSGLAAEELRRRAAGGYRA